MKNWFQKNLSDLKIRVSELSTETLHLKEIGTWIKIGKEKLKKKNTKIWKCISNTKNHST